MRRLLNMLKRIRLVYRRSSRPVRAVTLAAIILSATAVLTLHLSISASLERTNALKDQAAQLEQEQKEYNDKIDALGSADSVEQIARDELGMVDATTVIITPQE